MADSATPDPIVTKPEPETQVPESANTPSPVIEVPEQAQPTAPEPQPEVQTILSVQPEETPHPVETPLVVENPVPEIEIEEPKTPEPPIVQGSVASKASQPTYSQPETKVEPPPQSKTEPIATPPPATSPKSTPPTPEVRVEEREVVKEVKVVDEEKVSQLAQEKYQSQLDKNQKLGNEKRKVRQKEKLDQVVQFAQEKKIITNQQIRDLLHISQSTATNYLTTLVNRGILRMDRKAKATTYNY